MNDNKKPFNSLRLQISKVSEMMEIGPKFSDAVSVNHLLSMILKQTLDLMVAEVCIIWLKDNSGNLVPRISFGLRTSLIRSVSLGHASKVVKCIMNKDKLTNIYDLAKDKRVPMKKLIKREGLKSLLAAPLSVGEEKTGVLMICAKRAHRRFHEVDLKIFDALAKQSALAIANAGLYDRMDRKVKEKADEMTTLFTMSRSLSSAIDLDLILELILEKARALMRAKFCVLELLDDSRRRLHIASSARLNNNNLKTVLKFEKEIARNVLNGTPIVINDIETHFKGKVPNCLKKARIHSLVMVPIFSGRRRTGILSVYIPEVRIFEKEDTEVFEMVGNICSLAIDNTTMLDRIRKDYLNTIKTLAKIIDANDTYTRGHCEKVMKYSIMICKRLKLAEKDINAVKTASLLHDIGKVGIDLGVIKKTGKLSEEDWKKIRLHPEIGARILSQVGFLNDIVPIVRHHHERYGGGGYPDPARSGKKIPIGARIIAIADAFDAMTSDRPYRKAMTWGDAIKELKRCSSSQFDPKIVDAFLDVAKVKA